MATLYGAIAGKEGGAYEGNLLGTWQLIVTIRQIHQSEITSSAGKGRFKFDATQSSEFDDLVEYYTSERSSKAREVVFTELWFTILAAEYGFIDEPTFKAKLNIT